MRVRQLLVLGALLAALLLPGAGVSRGAAPTAFWHTDRSRIVDATGHTVRIAAVNWFGMEDREFVPGGLDRRPLDAILARVRSMGFNAIRLPFSNEMVERNPVVTAHLAANPSLRGLHALDLLDRIVASARAHGLRVILDNSRSEAGTVPERNGLWYTDDYPERAWIADWQALARRYLNDATVVGVDLRNEPHTAGAGPWSLKTYLTDGATWGPYRGMENRLTDWRLAAERAGNAVLAVNPNLLIIVEGIQQYPDPALGGRVEGYWWGGVLQGAARYPVHLAVAHRLVYSPHEYGPFKHAMPAFGHAMSYASLTALWKRHWSFLEDVKLSGGAPIFIGEFGTCGSSSACVDSSTPGSQGLWMRSMLRFLAAHPEIGWSFWALNGTSHVGDPCPNYLLGTDWKTIRLPALITALRRVEKPK